MVWSDGLLSSQRQHARVTRRAGSIPLAIIGSNDPGAITDRPQRDISVALVCLIVVLLPLEFTKDWFLYEGIDLARIVTTIALVGLVLDVLLRRRRLRRPPTPLLVGVLGVLAVDSVSGLVTGWPGAPKQLAAAWFLAAFGFVVMQISRTRRALELAGIALASSGVAEALVILGQQAGDFSILPERDLAGRRSGTFVDPNIATRVLLLGMLVGAAATGRAMRARLGVVLPALAILAAGVVPTLSRTGWLLTALIVVGWPILFHRDRRMWLASGAIGLGFVLAIALVPGATSRIVTGGGVDEPGPVASIVAPVEPARQPDADRATRTTPLDGLLEALPIDETRRYLARAGVAMFLDHPIAGVGLGGFQPMILGPYLDFVPTDYVSRPTTLAHTDLIRIAAEEGLIGLAAFGILAIGVVVTLIRAVARSGERDRLILGVIGSGLLLLVLAAQTEGRLSNEPYAWLLLGGLAAVVSRGPDWAEASARV